MLENRWIPLVFGLFLSFLGEPAARAQESPAAPTTSLAQYLPQGAIGTVETARLAPLIERIENSGALQMLLDSPQWREALKQEGVQKALAGKAIAEAQLGMSLWQFAKTYVGDRIILGVYPPSQPMTPPDGVLIIRVNQSSDLTKLWERVSPMIPLAGDKLKVADHPDGGRLLTLEDGNQVVIRDRWIVASKAKSLLDQTLKNLAAPPARDASLLSVPAWKEWTEQSGTEHHLQLCVDLSRLTQLAGHRLIPGKLDNPVLSLLLGGYLELGADSPYFGSTLDIHENHFKWHTSVAGDAKKLDTAHSVFVVDPQKAPTAEVPPIPNQLNGFSLARDFAGWYRNRESLLIPALLPGFDKFETGVATFLGGRDFGEDVLPMLGERLTIVTIPQRFSHLSGKPGVQLPGIGLMLDLAKPTEANDLLNLFFQTIVLVSNLQASQEGRQTFVLSSETYRETQVSYAKYVKQPEGATLPIAYNFQPASARVGNRYVFASSVETCHQLIDALKDTSPPPRTADRTASEGVRDLLLNLSPAVAADLLEANASVLQAQNVQQGKSAEQSTQELNALIKILRQLTPVTFTSTRFNDRWVLELSGGWK